MNCQQVDIHIYRHIHTHSPQAWAGGRASRWAGSIVDQKRTLVKQVLLFLGLLAATHALVDLVMQLFKRGLVLLLLASLLRLGGSPGDLVEEAWVLVACLFAFALGLVLVQVLLDAVQDALVLALVVLDAGQLGTELGFLLVELGGPFFALVLARELIEEVGLVVAVVVVVVVVRGRCRRHVVLVAVQLVLDALEKPGIVLLFPRNLVQLELDLGFALDERKHLLLAVFLARELVEEA